MEFSSLRLLAASCFTSVSASQATQVTAKATSSYAKTKYPIVFNHGMGGFITVRDGLISDSIIGIKSFLILARNGANVWATRVSPFNSTEVRGEQLTATSS